MKDKLTSFFLMHGEKLGFGLIVVMALFVLWGTRWSPYKKTPQELEAAAQKAEVEIKESIWPPEKKQELIPTKDIIARAKALRGGVDGRQYAFSTSIYTPIYPRSEPILPPKFLAPEDGIATASVVLVEIPTVDEESLEEGAAEGDAKPKVEEKDESDIPEGLRTRPKPSASGAADGLATPGLGCGAEAGAITQLSDNYGIAPPGCGEGGGMYGGEAETTVKRNGEGYRFVAIRFVLDWAAQKREYARALHLPPNEAARAEPVIQDFEIQRQRAVSVDRPWSGEWETLDIEDSVNVLKKAIDVEADVVDVTVTNSIITEPLPVRVLGIWDTLASHPRIANFKLSPEEQKLETMRIEKLRKAYEELNKNRTDQQLEPGGFGKYQVDIRSMTNELGMSGNSSYMEGYNADYADAAAGFYSGGANGGMTGAMPGARPGAGGAVGDKPDLLTSARSAASGRLLLFRYFDFEVEPGAVYRYRVRIKYVNPNYRQSIELLASPELAEGQSRTSDWSAPTQPVQVRAEADFYLTGVEYESKVRDDVAVMDVYKWNAPTGTVVNELKRYQIGDEIGGTIKSKVVNPLDKSYDVQEIKVNTGDLVIDFRKDDDLKIGGNLPDLGKVPASVRFDEVLVMNSYGNLQTFDRFTREKERVNAKRYQKIQNDIGKEYEEAAREAESGDDLLSIYGEGGGNCGGGEGGGYGGGGSSRPRSASSKLRNRRRSSGGGSGGGGY